MVSAARHVIGGKRRQRRTYLDSEARSYFRQRRLIRVIDSMRLIIPLDPLEVGVHRSDTRCSTINTCILVDCGTYGSSDDENPRLVELVYLFSIRHKSPGRSELVVRLSCCRER